MAGGHWVPALKAGPGPAIPGKSAARLSPAPLPTLFTGKGGEQSARCVNRLRSRGPIAERPRG